MLEKSGTGPAHIHVLPPLYCSPFSPHNHSTMCEGLQRGQGGMEEMKGVRERQAGMESA